MSLLCIIVLKVKVGIVFPFQQQKMYGAGKLEGLGCGWRMERQICCMLVLELETITSRKLGMTVELTLPDSVPGGLQSSCCVSDRPGGQPVNQGVVGSAAKILLSFCLYSKQQLKSHE